MDRKYYIKRSINIFFGITFFSWYFIRNDVSFIKVLFFAFLFFISIFIIGLLLGLLVYIISYLFSKTYIIKSNDYFIYKNQKVMFLDIFAIRYNLSESGKNYYKPSYVYIILNNDYVKIEKFSPFLLYQIKKFNPKIRIRLIGFKYRFLGLPLLSFIIGIVVAIIEYFV